MRNIYSISEFISTIYSLTLTKIFDPKSRLIRRPVYFRGKKSFQGGRSLTTGHGCRFDLPGEKKTLFIGDNCEIGDYVHIVAHQRVEIGNNVLMASKIFISDVNHGKYVGENQDSPLTHPNDRGLFCQPVFIGNNVWIGENAVILAGSHIGDGCVIGANSVVKGTFNEGSMVVGIPGRCIKCWDKEKQEWCTK